ncbi:hypothetical protein A3C96_01685 [Candidatus Uhrbacteria bacterium RIFCSPHIGHO2_02_FULL_60_10]|uniref:t-SNARE coiled-coil homology domain-containing protein n=1 Tax=Candidatus Uhrbacteria bacterium RIFCSPHIGHO2_02_FULL_60_10 TaxID=1802392 RepID=A0A1F7U3U9_9BACT|nr:MAG: hypothetical protein A3C96_01685 [Candidatus Uhrbacteria bacterium RIFCSPHIGHO2_02_FULL_60_10]
MPNEPTTRDIITVIEKNAAKSDERFVKTDATIRDVLAAVTGITDKVVKMDGRLDKMDGRLDKMDGRLDKMDGRFDALDKKIDDNQTELMEAINVLSTDTDGRFNKVDERSGRIEATMVTKDYLDEKLGKLKGALIEIDRKIDNKANKLINVLCDNKQTVLGQRDNILAEGPFAQA